MKCKLKSLSVSLLFSAAATAQPVDVLTVGSFHFDFPNLDVTRLEDSKQIDVKEDKYQQQLNRIVDQLAAFNPTHVVVERAYEKRDSLQSDYQQYRHGTFELPRSEVFQLGFRLADVSGLSRIHAADTWGKNFDTVAAAIASEEKTQAFGAYYNDNPDTDLRYVRSEPVYKREGIAAELLALNTPENIQKSLGNYLIGHFKYEFDKGDYFGADFETGRWFNRNLRIFRNIQRIGAQPGDRVIVIFGAGHMNLLNTFFDASPEYNRVPLRDYLSSRDMAADARAQSGTP